MNELLPSDFGAKQEVDPKLLDAARDLYQALCAVVALAETESPHQTWDSAIDQAKAALAKARGE